jgi:catechol 2,3-dioxygenase-like lactoylglutathione lyase family enzyme
MRPKVLRTTPLLIVSDLHRSLDFYCHKLGFVEPAVWGDPPSFAMINRDLFDLMLHLAETPDQVRPNGVHHEWDLYVVVEDLAAEMQALRTAGVAFDYRPEKTSYGTIEMEVVDPDGHRICFGQEVQG